MTKVQRYKVGYYTDEWGMSIIAPCLIPDDRGFAIRLEDYCKLETELATLKAENESLKRDAERYRYLKSGKRCDIELMEQDEDDGEYYGVTLIKGNYIDDKIDSAMKESK